MCRRRRRILRPVQPARGCAYGDVYAREGWGSADAAAGRP
ncbi:hypothetical protein EVA_19995 [gut metagenome]|uniref:Uncharacterized protein n=1 Tax=gut metagenome TaxID=749906 RepID=J9FBT5_9ZZZZ